MKHRSGAVELAPTHSSCPPSGDKILVQIAYSFPSQNMPLKESKSPSNHSFLCFLPRGGSAVLKVESEDTARFPAASRAFTRRWYVVPEAKPSNFLECDVTRLVSRGVELP